MTPASQIGGVMLADPIDNVLAALKTSNVYVEPGLAGTDNDTAGAIGGFLHADDHIVIVMMGNSSISDDALAQKILGSLESHSVLGLYVNGHTVAYSNLLPSSVVNDAMTSAENISMSPQETLTTYVRLVHEYEVAHPAPVKTLPTTNVGADHSPSPLPYVLGGSGLLLAIVVILAVILRKRRKQTGSPSQPASPSPVRVQVIRLRRLLDQINNPQVRNNLQIALSDTEEFFRRLAESKDDNAALAAQNFETNLSETADMLDRYIDIQDNPRYYDDADSLLRSGARSVKALSEKVLASIRSNSSDHLLEYRVSNELISATRNR